MWERQESKLKGTEGGQVAKLEVTGVRAPVAGERGMAWGEEPLRRSNRQGQISGLLFSGIRRPSLSSHKSEGAARE